MCWQQNGCNVEIDISMALQEFAMIGKTSRCVVHGTADVQQNTVQKGQYVQCTVTALYGLVGTFCKADEL